jgi:hypothetical protein
VTPKCKDALVATFGQEKVDEFPETLLNLMQRLYDRAHNEGVHSMRGSQGQQQAFDEGRERGFIDAREDAMYQMQDEMRWRENQAKQMAPMKNNEYGPNHR